MLRAELFIDGRWKANPSLRFKRINPASGQPATNAAAASIADARRAAEAAGRAFLGWADYTPWKRRDLLLAAKAAIESHADEIAAALIAETGASQAWADLNIRAAAEELLSAAALTMQSGEMTVPAAGGFDVMAQRRPHGPVLAVVSWTAPVLLAVRAVATALACGNTVVLKASEICPYTQSFVMKLIAEAGFPQGVINAITNAPDEAESIVSALIDHPQIRHIEFIGSIEVGRAIAVRAGRNLKSVHLDLGSAGPAIVLADADPEAAARAIAESAFLNHGQTCFASSRIVVLDAIAERFAEALANVVSSSAEGLAVRPMISEMAAQRQRSLVDNAVARGAIQLAGSSGQGAAVGPAVLDFVTPQMRVYSEECLGPIAAIVRVATEAEAIAAVNDGQTIGMVAVLGRDQGHALAVAAAIDAASCHINGTGVFGHLGMSDGVGSGASRRAVAERLTQDRYIRLHHQRDDQAM